MKITLKLYAAFRDLLGDSPGGCAKLDLAENQAVLDVIRQFKIPEQIPKIILINGVQKTAADTLNDGDTLSIFPPIAGG